MPGGVRVVFLTTTFLFVFFFTLNFSQERQGGCVQHRGAAARAYGEHQHDCPITVSDRVRKVGDLLAVETDIPGRSRQLIKPVSPDTSVRVVEVACAL